MKTVLIAGGSGLVGSFLQNVLKSEGYDVFILTRDRNKAQQNDKIIYWNIEEKFIDEEALGADHVINLAGAGIADARWTKKRKQAIINSRVQSTELLIQFFKTHNRPLQSYMNASAMGIYGDSGERLLTEDAVAKDEDFLSEVCEKWEASADGARDIARSVTILRISTVLSTRGGALPKMTQSIPFGLAPYFGSGRQYISWVHIEDLCRMITFLLSADHKYEAFNAASGHAMTNKDFTRSLTKAINPLAICSPVPAVALRLTMGEMSQVVLNSCRLSIDKLKDTGFECLHSDLIAAVKDLRERKI